MAMSAQAMAKRGSMDRLSEECRDRTRGEEMEHLGDLRDLAPAQLDVMAAGDELEDAPPEVGAVLDHRPGGALVRVEDVPGIAKQRSQSARPDHAQPHAGLRVEEIVLHVHRGEAAVLDDQDRLGLRFVGKNRQFRAQAEPGLLDEGRERPVRGEDPVDAAPGKQSLTRV